MTLHFYSTVWKLRIDQVNDMHSEFCLSFTAPAKWRIELWAKIGQYRNRCFPFHPDPKTTQQAEMQNNLVYFDEFSFD